MTLKIPIEIHSSQYGDTVISPASQCGDIVGHVVVGTLCGDIVGWSSRPDLLGGSVPEDLLGRRAMNWTTT